MEVLDMAPLLIAAALQIARIAAPRLVSALTGSDRAVEVAERVIDVAQQVTGASTPDEAVAKLQADPALVMQANIRMQELEIELQKVTAASAAEVNSTMRAEGQSEHWPTYSWRPAIGFAVALNVVLSSLTVFGAYFGAMVFGKTEGLQHLPGMLAAMAGLIAVVAPILGIASWFRGRMQADPAIASVNRG
jgi:hypothetical protein